MIWALVCLTCSQVGFFLGCLLFGTHIFYSPSHFSWTPLPSLHDVSYSYDWSNSYETGSKVHYKKWDTLSPPYRVAGSMHSVSPLVSDTILVVPSGIIESNTTHVRAYAGTRLEDIQKHIKPYTMRGIGSILKQTLGGAFSTSLSGIETVSFTEFVEEIVYETPSGVHRSRDLYHLKDTMGMVGIITEMTVRIFPNRNVEFHSEFRVPKKDVHLISGYDVVDTILLGEELHVVTYNVTEVTNETRSRPSGVAFLWDLFGLPLLIPSSIRRSFVKGSLKSKQDLRTIGADAAMYGSMFVDYRIPLENCSAFLNITTDAIVRVKYLQPRSDACLSYSGPTCKVELYYTRFENAVLFDDEAYVLGGYPHWGKLTENVTRFLDRFSCFKDVPVQSMFLNGYLKGDAFTAWDGSHRVWWTRLWQVIGLAYIGWYIFPRRSPYKKLDVI